MAGVDMLAPTPGHSFIGCPSGTTYQADSNRLVAGVLSMDLLCMLSMGCVQTFFTLQGDPNMTYQPQATAYAAYTISSNTFTLTALNDEVLVNKSSPSATAIAITAMNIGHQYQFKDQAQNSATYPITLTTSLGDGKIDGQTSQVINQNDASLTLIFNGTTTNIV